MNLEKSIQEYLSKKENKTIKLVEIKELGSGWHGKGFEIVYEVDDKKKSVILRTQNPISFSHDFYSDRAASFLLQHKISKNIPGHIRSLDVCALTSNGKLISIGEAEEFYQLVEKADGTPYMEDLERIKKEGKLSDADRKKALLLSDYLVDLHKTEFDGSIDAASSIRKRHIRDTVGHGEMFLGVLDTYPPKLTFASRSEITELAAKTVKFQQNIKDLPIKLARMHGDFHPGNIWFKNDRDFVLLDASREEWGTPADDLTALAINYIWFALMQSESFDGPFAELFKILWENYLKKTGDKSIEKVAPLFFAFRGVVVAHPVFYQKQSNKVRRKIFNILNNILSEKIFDHKKINSYLRR